MIMDLSEVEKKLTHYLAEQSDIDVAYLFGSQVSGSARHESDIDIALLFNAGQIPKTERKLEVEDNLTSLLKAKLDIVILNNSSPVIRMQVLKKGRKVFDRDHKAFINFFVRTIKEYDDLKRVRSINENKVLRGRIYG